MFTLQFRSLIITILFPLNKCFLFLRYKSVISIDRCCFLIFFSLLHFASFLPRSPICVFLPFFCCHYWDLQLLFVHISKAPFLFKLKHSWCGTKQFAPFKSAIGRKVEGCTRKTSKKLFFFLACACCSQLLISCLPTPFYHCFPFASYLYLRRAA